jgi:hypothetical protein
MKPRSTRAALAALAWLLSAGGAFADPWLAPGDAGLRADIQLLADAGILHGPVTTWPLSWPDVARDALAETADSRLDFATQAALLRVQRLARNAANRGSSDTGLRAAGAYEPSMLRGFEATPREEGEFTHKRSWLGSRAALNLQFTLALDPDDDKKLRPDGSYLGVNIGNFMVSAGYMERWWGPGWDGSLILSTNARPIPSLTIERNYTDPFKTKLLSWLGPWRASIAVGQAEGSHVAVADVRFLAMRVNFKPRPWLELALTRTAQWCGDGRPCGWATFQDMLVGNDNRDDTLAANDEPGNQLAGYDMRLRSPWRKLPLAFYTQWIGEDEAGGLPSKFLGLFGLEYWGGSGLGNHRVRFEYADTACTFSREQPDYNCAYRNSLYPQGYTHRGRVIGHAMDNDSRMYSVGLMLTRPKGDVASLTVRRVELNRDGGPHAISSIPLEINNVEMQYSRDFGFGKVSLGLGFDDKSDDSAPIPDSRVHGFVGWQQGF